MAYVKLDTGILDSTLWSERDSREIFITALLMATPKEIEEAMPQLSVRSLEPTGFVVPPGKYGFVAAAGIGIGRRAGLDEETTYKALEVLGSPEGQSRSPEFEGRRLVRVAGGYVVLNYFRYRDKDHTAAIRQQRKRDRDRALRHTVTSRNITYADADADNKPIVPPVRVFNTVRRQISEPMMVWDRLIKTGGKEPERTPQLQEVIDAAGGWVKIKARGEKESPYLEKAFCEAYRRVFGGKEESTT
jgi:hypothetical protein